MDATPTSGQGRDLTRYCAAACDLNHAAIPHVPWDCNAPAGGPTLSAGQRRALPEAELPWVRYATPLLLSTGEVDRLREPITSAIFALPFEADDQATADDERCCQQLEAVDERLIRAQLEAERASSCLDVPARFGCPDANRLREVLGEAAARLDEVARRRDAADPPYLLGSEHFTKTAEELRGWCQATLARQQQRGGCAREEPAIAAALELDDRDRQRLQDRAASRQQAHLRAAERWAGRGRGVGRAR
jgi:hypothetical protein